MSSICRLWSRGHFKSHRDECQHRSLYASYAPAILRKNSRQVFDSSHEAHLGSVARNGVDAQEQALELWNNIKSALMGVAAMRITEYVSELIPGFDEHYRRAQSHDAGRT